MMGDGDHDDDDDADGRREEGGGGGGGRKEGRKENAGHRLFKTRTQHHRMVGNNLKASHGHPD